MREITGRKEESGMWVGSGGEGKEGRRGAVPGRRGGRGRGGAGGKLRREGKGWKRETEGREEGGEVGTRNRIEREGRRWQFPRNL